MAHETSPAFQFYVKEWRSSRAVQRMTFAQRGMYLEMLIEQWDKGSLPDDPAACADLLGGTVEEWTAAWPALRRKFVDRRARQRGDDDAPIPTDHDASRRIINLRLEKVRRELHRFKAAARKGGINRAKTATRTDKGTYRKNQQPADNQGTWAPAGSANQVPSSTASATASATARARPASPPRRALGAGNRSGVMAGALPANHLDHLACFPVCMTPRIAEKFIGRFAGDREKLQQWAGRKCREWQGRVERGERVAEGDDFAFWTARYDEDFKQQAKPPDGPRVAGVEDTQRYLTELRTGGRS